MIQLSLRTGIFQELLLLAATFSFLVAFICYLLRRRLIRSKEFLTYMIQRRRSNGDKGRFGERFDERFDNWYGSGDSLDHYGRRNFELLLKRAGFQETLLRIVSMAALWIGFICLSTAGLAFYAAPPELLCATCDDLEKDASWGDLIQG